MQSPFFVLYPISLGSNIFVVCSCLACEGSRASPDRACKMSIPCSENESDDCDGYAQTWLMGHVSMGESSHMSTIQQSF